MNLSREVIDHERIKTTEAKAKAVKPEVEKLITLAKRGDLHARRQAMSTLGQDKFIVYKLFEEIAPRYAERDGRLHAHPEARSAQVGLDRDGLPRARLATLGGSSAARLELAYDGAAFAGWARQPGQAHGPGRPAGRARAHRRRADAADGRRAAPTPASTPRRRSRATRPARSPARLNGVLARDVACSRARPRPTASTPAATRARAPTATGSRRSPR